MEKQHVYKAAVVGIGRRTFLIMLLERLVMLSPYLRPAREVVLGADGGHVALEADHLAAQAGLGLEVLRGAEREASVELP